MQIEHEIGETKGRYFVSGSTGEILAELSYSIAGTSMIIIDHTEVSDQLKGQGVGHILFMRMVEDARTSGTRVVPLCPFAKSQFTKFPETRDVT